MSPSQLQGAKDPFGLNARALKHDTDSTISTSPSPETQAAESYLDHQRHWRRRHLHLGRFRLPRTSFAPSNSLSTLSSRVTLPLTDLLLDD